MKNRRCVFLLLILLLLPFHGYSQSGSLSERIESEITQLEILNENYKQVEKQLEESEKNLALVEESLQKAMKDSMELSAAYEKSQKKLKFWRISLTIAIPASLVTGFVIGACISNAK